MPRANRICIPGQVWHLTHRCHKQTWLLKFGKDRLRWIHWLFKAKQRFGLCVLNYMVTSNHIHLLVQDQGRNEISKSMQLIAGRTGQEFNRRKNRHGAFWEDRYHATAVQSDHHLASCMTYIDLNMVRAGAVSHPGEWHYSGFHELHHPPHRKSKLDAAALMAIFEQPSVASLADFFRSRAEEQITSENLQRDDIWSESAVVGDEEFIQAHHKHIKVSNPGLRKVVEKDRCALREPDSRYLVHSGIDSGRLSPKYGVIQGGIFYHSTA